MDLIWGLLGKRRSGGTGYEGDRVAARDAGTDHRTTYCLLLAIAYVRNLRDL